MKKCRVCGKTFDVLWPEMWRYKRGTDAKYTYFCSWKCLREHDRKAEEKKMEKESKRGRPARKLDAEVADKMPETAEKAEVPEKPGKIFGKEPLEVYAIKSGILVDGKYCKEAGGMTLRGLSIGGSEIHMKEREWCAFSQEILVALGQLRVKPNE